jgi:hypothetical protein
MVSDGMLGKLKFTRDLFIGKAPRYELNQLLFSICQA